MASTDAVFLTQDAAERTKACVLDFERRPTPPRPGKGNRPAAQRPNMRGILLEDLLDEGTADVAVTQQFNSTAMQVISLLGFPSGGTFQIGFKGKTTIKLALRSTASQVQTALQALETIGTGNVRVTMGDVPAVAASGTQQATAELFPAIWIVEFVGVFATRDPATIPLLTITDQTTGIDAWAVASTVWADTGAVETVSAIIPVETPTPLRAGAVVVCVPFPSVGYGVIACEPRVFNASYY